MSISYQAFLHAAASSNFGFVGPAPLFPRLNILPQVLIQVITSAHVSPRSAQMSFYKFIRYCLYRIIYLRQPGQPIFQQHIHVRACACVRGISISDIYFEFVRKWSDRADAFNARAVRRADRRADRGLTEG